MTLLSSQVHSSNEEKILECIDKAFDVFGLSVKSVIYFRFQSVYSSKRADIIRKPELFSECIRTFFGERAFHVEAALVASITSKFPRSNVTLSDILTREIVEARKQEEV